MSNERDLNEKISHWTAAPMRPLAIDVEEFLRRVELRHRELGVIGAPGF